MKAIVALIDRAHTLYTLHWHLKKSQLTLQLCN